MKVSYIYSDNFTNELVSPKDIDFGIAPPERYLKIVRLNDETYYTETWTIQGQEGDADFVRGLLTHPMVKPVLEASK